LRELAAEPVDVADEAFGAVRCSGVVLGIGAAQVGGGLLGLVIVECLLVEGHDECLVPCCGHDCLFLSRWWVRRWCSWRRGPWRCPRIVRSGRSARLGRLSGGPRGR